MDIAGRKPDQQWLEQVIATVGLAGRLSHRPTELSGGQQQRVAVARALASRPEIIFGDEPTGNLDSRSGAEVLGFLRDSVRELGQTVVMVTHDPVAAAYADRVVFLADGRIVDEMLAPDRRRRARPHEALRRRRAVRADPARPATSPRAPPTSPAPLPQDRPPMLRTALRNVLAHKARLMMTALAVMLGVAFVSGTLVFTDTVGDAFKNAPPRTSSTSPSPSRRDGSATDGQATATARRHRA